MKALVTGCAGFIGSHLVDKLLDEVIGMGLGYVKLFCEQKPLLKKMLTLLFCKQKPLLKLLTPFFASQKEMKKLFLGKKRFIK